MFSHTPHITPSSTTMTHPTPHHHPHHLHHQHQSTPTPLVSDQFPELECPLCYRTFYEPVTLPCGHTFDRACLARVYDFKTECPLCREVIHILPERMPITVVVSELVQKMFYKELKERQLEEMQNKSLNSSNIPMFILNHVLYPEQKLDLHIFEPRYRLMIRRCMSGSRSFGLVPCGPDGQMAKYGCLARIQSFEMLADGRSLLEARGERRFEVKEKWEVDGYICGKVEWIDDIPSTVQRDELQQWSTMCHQLIENTLKKAGDNIKKTLQDRLGPLPSALHAEHLSYWLANSLPLSIQVKLDLLKMQSTKDRLMQLYPIAKELIDHVNRQNNCSIQ